MAGTFRILGHGWSRQISYKDGREYKTLDMPAGALMTARLLGAARKLPADIASEHLTLSKAGEGYAIGVSSGWTGKTGEISIGTGKTTLVYDEGHGITADIAHDTAVFWASNKCLPDREIFAPIKRKAFLMLDADVLRRNGALISRQVSWERTATDLMWQIKNNPKFTYLTGTDSIFITFAEEGAVLLRGSGTPYAAKLMLPDGKSEGQLREECTWNIPDTWDVKVACAALEWQGAKKTKKCFNADKVLYPAGELLRKGYSISALESGSFESWLLAPPEKTPYIYDIPEPSDRQLADPDYWCISNSFKNNKLYDIAYSYVMEGAKAIDGIPAFSCGKLTTVDRREIEAFQNIKNLLSGYAADKSVRPLSIAVFGAPGSGKSFGVKQIAKKLIPGVSAIEINVSQLTCQNDLSSAFHTVRDIVLEGKLPLVFFDEFDSDRDGKQLGWLKSFLMPMQDGKFKDENGEHPVGKCIFVFAGGTSTTFEDFCAPMQSDDPVIVEKFKNIKGPDFVSRLRGTINILGPNQAGSGEKNYILRRALLLRSFLSGKGLVKDSIAQVNEDVLRAMLLVPKYKHGARSMESILDMSRMEGASWEPVSLPFYTQMSLHLDADAFIRLVLKNVILQGYNEALAEAIHEDFRTKQKQRKLKIDPEVDLGWEKLSEEYKNDNREQASDMPNKLRIIGCTFDAGDTPYPSVERFEDEEIEALAEYEHLRWLRKKELDGWVYAAERNNKKKHHPLMVPFKDLPKEEKRKDADAAENIIPLLRSIGLRVYRTV